MTPKKCEALQLKGIKIRTNSVLENTQKGKLEVVWKTFLDDILPQLEVGTEMYSSYYYNEESFSEFDVIVGVKRVDIESCHIETELQLSTVDIEAGDFLVFNALGERPNAMYRAWQQIRQYFNEDNCEYRRTHKVDYVHYIDSTMSKIYISVVEKATIV